MKGVMCCDGSAEVFQRGLPVPVGTVKDKKYDLWFLSGMQRRAISVGAEAHCNEVVQVRAVQSLVEPFVKPSVNTLAELSAKLPVKASAQSLVESSVKTSAEASAQLPVELPAEASAKLPAQLPLKAPVKSSVARARGRVCSHHLVRNFRRTKDGVSFSVNSLRVRVTKGWVKISFPE